MKSPEFSKMFVYGTEAAVESKVRAESPEEGRQTDASLRAFEIRRQVVASQLEVATAWRRFWFVTATLLLIVAIFSVAFWSQFRIGIVLLLLSIISFVFSKLLTSGTLRQHKLGIQIEEELRETTGKDWEQAYKLFRLNGLDLRQYYDLNRHHSWIMLATGLLCLAFGLGIIVAAGYMVLSSKSAVFGERELVVGVLGAVGGILTNYVAAVYLKMYAGVSHALNDFHNRLVSTHHLHLAYFVASKIRDGKTRTQAMKDIAHEFSKL